MRRALLVLVLACAALAATAATASAVGIDYSCRPGPCEAWHNTPVTLRWVATGGSLSCPASEQIATDGVTVRSCTAVSSTGSAQETATVRVDLTPPAVTGATTSRLPDHGGWYRAPVQIAFSGTDATSGLRGCTTLVYGGPDGDPATPVGTCTDIAGNVSAPSPFALRYDATAPVVAPPTARTGDRIVRLRWHAPADAASVSIVRTPGRRGAANSVVHRGGGSRLVDRRVHNRHRYRYTLRVADAAGNATTVSATATPGRRLLGPPDGAVLRSPPRLDWTRARGARYYNVQLFRGGHKVLSSWPRHAHLALRRTWRYAGHRRRLHAGRYRWYVWPGRGRPSARRYGKEIGHARFRIAAG